MKNSNFIGKFCHLGGENYYKEKQGDIKYGENFQWSGGQCYKGCQYTNNNCNEKCDHKYPFPYYYYNKFLDIFDIDEKNEKNMEKKSFEIASKICKKKYK